MKKSAAEAGERSLVRRVGRGDQEAFETLFDRYSKPLLRLAWLSTHDYEAAADLVQETFLALWRRQASVAEQSVFPWLVSTLRLNIRNHQRWLARHPVAELDQINEALVQGAAHYGEDLTPIISEINGLTLVERQLVSMCMVDGLTYAEASKLLGLTEYAVGKRVQRLKARLRKAFVERSYS